MQWCLSALLFILALHDSWTGNDGDRYEFLRRGGDALGYYQWLPAVLLDHDVDRMYWTYDMGDGRWLSLFNIGVALLQLPFFLFGHLTAMALGAPLSGFSEPYMAALLCGSSFYLALGGAFTYRLARLHTTAMASAITVLLTFAATNLYFYSVYEPLMSHVYSYFLITLFTWCSLSLLRKVTVRIMVAWVLSASLIVLVRPLNVIVYLLPFLVWARFPGGVMRIVREVIAHPRPFVLAVLIALVPWCLQSAYWHHVTGSWLLFTYGEKGEGFDLIKMVPGMVLTSTMNGWLTYTPILAPVLLFLLLGAWRGVLAFRTIALIFTVIWLSYAAWWCWWLGGAFGFRGFIDLYGMLALPMALMIDTALRGGWWVRPVGALVVIVCIRLNIGLSERYDWRWSTKDWDWPQLIQVMHTVLLEDVRHGHNDTDRRGPHR